jgi:hypothetical protein
MLSDFLSGARAAVVVEDGAIAFDLADSKYSISGEYHKCLLHRWSDERNVVRRVLDAEVKATTLRLQVQRMGQRRPTRLDFCRDRDRRSPAARRAARVAYEPRLRRALERNFPEWTIVRLTTSVDLERSFGPAYLRGWIRQGRRAHLRDSLARGLSAGTAGTVRGRRTGDDRAERHGYAYTAAYRASASHGSEMARVRI